MKRNLIIAGVALLVLGFLFWRSRDEQVIKRQCKTLISMADSVDGGVGIFDLNRLEALLADRMMFHIEVVDPEPFQAGQIEVISAYQWLSSKVEKSEFKITEFKRIRIEGNRAWVETEVTGTLEVPEMRMLEGVHACSLHWLKTEEGDWELTEFHFD